MHSGTYHFVISTSNCLAAGGHFFFPPHLHKVLRAMAKEHFMGDLTTNTAHSSCGILFTKMLSYVQIVTVRNQEFAASGGPWGWIRDSLDPIRMRSSISNRDHILPRPTRSRRITKCRQHRIYRCTAEKRAQGKQRPRSSHKPNFLPRGQSSLL